MARRSIGTNSFDLTRDDLRDSPDPSIAAPLRAVLAPVEPDPVIERFETFDDEPHEPLPSPFHPHGEIARSRVARGTGGRPPLSTPVASQNGMRVITVRIPADLYTSCLPLVKGDGKPSWAQLITWTCEDHEAEVSAELAAHGRSGRSVRGANRAGAATTQVSPRFAADEMVIFEPFAERASKTAAVTAALIVARRHAE